MNTEQQRHFAPVGVVEPARPKWERQLDHVREGTRNRVDRSLMVLDKATKRLEAALSHLRRSEALVP